MAKLLFVNVARSKRGSLSQREDLDQHSAELGVAVCLAVSGEPRAVREMFLGVKAVLGGEGNDGGSYCS